MNGNCGHVPSNCRASDRRGRTDDLAVATLSLTGDPQAHTSRLQSPAA